jgi:hypothetical protein
MDVKPGCWNHFFSKLDRSQANCFWSSHQWLHTCITIMAHHAVDRKNWEFWVSGTTTQYLRMIIALRVENPNLWRGGTRLTIAGDSVKKFGSWWSPLPDCIDAMRQFQSLSQKQISIWMTIWKLLHYVSSDCTWLPRFYPQDHAITEWHRQALKSCTPSG